MSSDALEWKLSTGMWPSLPLPCTRSHAPPSPSPLSSIVYRIFKNIYLLIDRLIDLAMLGLSCSMWDLVP